MPGLTFRSEALQKLASPEQLDQLIRVTTPNNWLALASLVFLLAPLMSWSLWGSLEMRIEAQGLLLPAGGLCVIPALEDGQVSETLVTPGSMIQVGQVAAQLSVGGDRVSDVISLCAGRVASAAARPGDPVQRGGVLFTVEPSEQPLEVVSYLPLEEGRSILPGMEARISPAGSPADMVGYLLGTVRSVGQYPIDPQTLSQQVGSQSLAQTFAQQGALVDVHILLSEQSGGYRWSLNRQPNQPLTSGTPASVSILLDRRAPIEIVFPKLRQ